MNEETPLLTFQNGKQNGKSIIDSHVDDELLSSLPIIDMRRPQHEKTVSLLLEDEVEHIFRIVEPGESVEGENDDFHIKRERSDSFMSEITEIISEVKEELREVLQEDLTTPIKPRDEGDHSQKLSAVALAVLVFYKVSGGPFGCEPAVKAAGPLLALAGFTALPLLVSIPEALVTAELGSAYPEPSGAVAWVEEAFGPKMSLLCGYFHWVSGATDNAIYPSLFLKYVAFYMNSQAFFQTDLVRFLFTAGITVLLSLINYSGLHIVGNLSIIICIVSMSPFIIMVLLAIPRLDPRRWLVLPVAHANDVSDDDATGFFATPVMAGVHWRPLLNSLFWNLNSFDVGASFAGEVRDPERVFPRAMFLSVIFVVFSYLLPLLAALGAVDTQQDDWDAGFFTTVAIAMGGAWLGAYTVLASAISNIALFEAEMSGDAYQLMGMADRGLIPKWFTKRSRFGTPVNGIVTGTIVIILMSVADFDQLVEMLNFAYSLSILLEYAAFAKLRITDGDGTYRSCSFGLYLRRGLTFVFLVSRSPV